MNKEAKQPEFTNAELTFISDLAANELDRFGGYDPSFSPAEVATLKRIIDRIGDALWTEGFSPAPSFGAEELVYIHNMAIDEVAALDEADDDERVEGSIEIAGRIVSKLNRYFQDANRS
jgi:hypothetical protein